MNRRDRRRAASTQRKGAAPASVPVPAPAVTQLLATATSLHNTNRFAEASAVCRQVLARDRDNFDAHLLLGSAADNLGEAALARTQLERASALRPHDPRPWVVLGTHLTRAGDYAAAMRACQQAIEAAPAFAPGHVALGTLLSLQRAYDAAEPAFRRALELAPGYLDAEINLGSCLFYLGRPEEALGPLRRALALAPEHPWALKNLAATQRALGRYDEALAGYRRATAAAPQFADAHRDEALLLLLLGRFEEGWRKYEWRRRASTRGVRPLDGEYWDGGPLAGRTILLVAEQGAGDTLQMLRYVPRIAAQAASVKLMLPRGLLRLEGDALAAASLHAQDAAPPPFDCWAQLMSLPGLLGTTADSIPAPIPYLRAPAPARRELAGKGRAVGLVWAGNPEHENDHNRSIPFARLKPLLALDGISRFSLQVGPRSADLAGVAGITDLAPSLQDFGDTAAAIDALDLVITVDTSVAHLAGAMGKPVWLLLPYVPDWRWLLDRADTPWYPTMRLFRQVRRGDWDEVIGRVAEELARG
jgi:tetratricopeptide (TPR) repeat protein